MQNIIIKHKEDTGKTYRKMADDINKILKKQGEPPILLKRSLIGYALGKNVPDRSEVTSAMAIYFNTNSAELLKNLRECKNEKYKVKA